MDTFLQDVRHALRGLVKSPGFTLAVVLTLALAIGANTAIFGVVNAVLLRPLPYPRPDELVAVAETMQEKGWAFGAASPANYLDFRDQTTAFAALAAYDDSRVALVDERGARRVEALEATPDLFRVLGTVPLHGRLLAPEDAVRGQHHVAVLSHGLFVSHFAGDAGVLGRTIVLEGEPHRVIGVLPRDFRFPTQGAEVYLPLVMPKDVQKQRGAHYLRLVGRLAPGVTAEEANRQVGDVAKRLAAEYPRSNKGWSAAAEPLKERVVGKVRPALLILFGAVGLVTLIACANVAGLLLARGIARESDVAVRIALGAGRGRIVRQRLVESALLALVGGGLALTLASWLTGGLTVLAAGDVPRLGEVRLDGDVFLFTAALACLATLLAGLVPAIQASRPAVADSLKSRERAAAGKAEQRSRVLLVVGEIALTLTLLAGAGVLAKSFRLLLHVDTGFDPENVLTFNLTLPEASYPDGEHTTAFTRQLLARLESLPGAKSAGAVFGLPLTGFGFSGSFSVEGSPVPKEDEPSAQVRLAAGRYFETMRIPLRRGRLFGPDDRRGSPKVLLASEQFAHRFFPAGNALGQRLKFGVRFGPDAIEGEIVGIVGDVRDDGLDTEPRPLVYCSGEQVSADYLSFAVKTAVPPLTLAEAARQEVAALDPAIPVAEVASMEQVVSTSVARPRFLLVLLGAFATVALTLSAVGLYGVIAYGVTRRTREIGVRVALGAERRDVLGLILGQGVRMALAGLAIGTLLAIASTRLLSGLLFGVSPTDASAFAGVSALLLVVALAATYLPARRAARVDPAEALRAE